jgi:signal transduction histidine kinase
MLDDLGLLPALAWHFDRYDSQMGIHVTFKHTGLEGQRFDPELETAAYRIVQEALTNAARHARIDNVDVDIGVNQGALHIRIRDRGVGFNPDSRSNRITGGLSGMRERAVMLRGRLKIESASGAGTVLTAELPLAKS